METQAIFALHATANKHNFDLAQYLKRYDELLEEWVNTADLPLYVRLAKRRVLISEARIVRQGIINAQLVLETVVL